MCLSAMLVLSRKAASSASKGVSSSSSPSIQCLSSSHSVITSRAATRLLSNASTHESTAASILAPIEILDGVVPNLNLKLPLAKFHSPLGKYWRSSSSASDLIINPSDSPRPLSSLSASPVIHLGTGLLATLCSASVIGISGSTTIMSTVSLDRGHSPGAVSSNDDFVPLTVEYKQRHHATGRIPGSVNRRDNLMPTEAETLGCRVIDRVLRPLIGSGVWSSEDKLSLTCSVQSFDKLQQTQVHLPSATAISSVLQPKTLEEAITSPSPKKSGQRSIGVGGRPSSASASATPLSISISTPAESLRTPTYAFSPLPLAVNASSSALLLADEIPFYKPAAAVRVVLISGPAPYRERILIDPSEKDAKEWLVDMIYAGQGECTLMIELGVNENALSLPSVIAESESSGDKKDPGIKEEVVGEMMRRAHASIKPLIECQWDLLEEQERVNGRSGGKMKRRPGQNGELSRFFTERAEEEEGFHGAHTTFDEAFEAVHKQFMSQALAIFTGDSAVDNSKAARGKRQNELRHEVDRFLSSNGYYLSGGNIISQIMEKLFKSSMRDAALAWGRSDARSLSTVRPISCAAPSLPSTVHGSSIFSRGETQVLCTVTLGSPSEGLPLNNPYSPQRLIRPTIVTDSNGEPLPVGSLRSLKGPELLSMLDVKNAALKTANSEIAEVIGSFDVLENKRAYLHYDFPGYSVGEAASGGASANRRSIGHGILAEKAVLPVLPSSLNFPYSIRMTSEVTGSNGSSSMASACGVTLALLDAGVPICTPVAAISVGLVSKEAAKTTPDGHFVNKEDYALMADITGTEDHYGDMDFKVGGTAGGITCIQLDVKRPDGVPVEVLIEGLETARLGRMDVLEEMAKGIEGGLVCRRELKESAPRVEVVKFSAERKRDLIGPGGVVLKQIEDRYGVILDLTCDGQCLIFGSGSPELPGQGVKEARNAVQELVGEVNVGGVYEAVVLEIKDFGAIVEIMRNKEALLHISEITDDKSIMHSSKDGNLGVVEGLIAVGMKLDLVCMGVDRVRGHIRLSRRELVRRQMGGGKNSNTIKNVSAEGVETLMPSARLIDSGISYIDPDLVRARTLAVDYSQASSTSNMLSGMQREELKSSRRPRIEKSWGGEKSESTPEGARGKGNAKSSDRKHRPSRGSSGGKGGGGRGESGPLRGSEGKSGGGGGSYLGKNPWN